MNTVLPEEIDLQLLLEACQYWVTTTPLDPSTEGRQQGLYQVVADLLVEILPGPYGGNLGASISCYIKVGSCLFGRNRPCDDRIVYIPGV